MALYKLFAFLSLAFVLTSAYQPYCYRRTDFADPRATILRCPEEEWFTYYDCCEENTRCCNYIKWPILILFPLAILGLIAGLIPLFYYLFHRDRYYTKHVETERTRLGYAH
uniref:Uncharacterized protein n=1 Tax=Acrobeloides nanus TaxID=290746 RepID=A0A914E564_9BILA